MPTLYWSDDDGALQVVKLDVATSEEYADTLTVTDHPVEQGANVVDHAREDPERITVEGLVTNAPHQGNLTEDDEHEVQNETLKFEAMGPPGTQTIELDIPGNPIQVTPSGLIQAAVGAVVSLLTGGQDNKATAWDVPKSSRVSTTAQVLKTSDRKNRGRLVYEKLLSAQKGRFLVTVQAGMREYFDMLLERIALPRGLEDGTSARFQLDLRRLRVAESETVQSPEPTEARGATTKSRGSQHAGIDPNGDKKNEKRKSLLKSGADSALGP
jgi:hypothetical protein